MKNSNKDIIESVIEEYLETGAGLKASEENIKKLTPKDWRTICSECINEARSDE